MDEFNKRVAEICAIYSNAEENLKQNIHTVSVDEKTGYKTRNILCAPIINIHGKTIGVIQLLNKKEGQYTSDDLNLTGLKRIIMRRASLELKENMFVNLGYGMSDGVPIVAQEEGIADKLIFMIEQGSTGGIPTSGLNFGAMYNPTAILDDGYQFDFFQGGGLDIAYLGFAQIDQFGNVNSSRFGNILTGCGGFIDISQNAKKVVFCGSFAVKSQQEITPNGLEISNSGKFTKFINKVEQITFSSEYALENNISIKQNALNISLSERDVAITQGNFLPSINASSSGGLNSGLSPDRSGVLKNTTKIIHFRILSSKCCIVCIPSNSWFTL